jgi:hypothetical protein
MNFNVDRIAQLAGLSGAGGSGAGSLNESAGRRARPATTGRRARPATTYDRVVEELQVRGLEMFYSPEQINEAIRTESRLLREEREMEMEAMHHGDAEEGMGMYEADDDGLEEMLDQEAEAMAGEEPEEEGMHYGAADEGLDDMEQGTVIRTPRGTEMKITKGMSAGKTSLAETKLRRVITAEVDRVLAEMTNSGDTSWMYSDRKRPSGRSKGATMGFAGVGFKR